MATVQDPHPDTDQVNPHIILASTSPRRQELLQQVGVSFTTAVIDIDESALAQEDPADYVRRLACLKAQAALPYFDADHLIIAADTSVTIDGLILGKPTSRLDAFSMWSLLSGRSHYVMTGVAVAYRGQIMSVVVTTEVEFLPLTQARMQAYWDSGEPIGKAGGYAIQGRGAAFIPRIDGSYSNVVGLPLAETLALIEQALLG